jgi:hypothetical protein
MRIALTALLLVALSAPAGAQAHSHRDRSTDEVWRPSIGLPLPQIGLPLPQIGLPLPPIGLPPHRIERPERSERSERFERPERSERSVPRRSPGAATVFFPSYGWPYPYLPGAQDPLSSSLTPTYPVHPPRATGRLRVDLQSGIDPQIYIDGYYVGLLSDASGGELTLDAGTHALELREEGYEPVYADIVVPQDAFVTYRAELKWIAPTSLPVAEAPRAPSPPPAPTTIYVIPGCYVGNVPPRDALLPSGCNPADAVEFLPAR